MYSEKKLNHYEDVFFKKMLEKKHINKSFHYSKISDYNEGEKFLNKLNDYKNIDILSIEVCFIMRHTDFDYLNNKKKFLRYGQSI